MESNDESFPFCRVKENTVEKAEFGEIWKYEKRVFILYKNLD